MARKLIPLSFHPSTELPEVDELRAFLTTEFGRQVPGFTVLEADAKWGELTLDLVGVEAGGRLVAVFPAVSRQERAFHEVISQAMIASTWVEENRAELTRAYGDRGANPDEPLRMILVAPATTGGSRAMTRTLDRAGVEVMPYSIYEIEAGDDKLLALSFDAGAAPASAGAAAPPRQAPTVRETERPRESAAPEPSRAEQEARSPFAEPPREVPPPAPEPPPPPRPAAPPKPPSPVEMFILSMADPTLKAMSEQILTFLVSRFPGAEGIVAPQDRGFTLTVTGQHLATIRLDKTALWLEVGPERIPTNKIKDPATLERAMNLPSVLDALGSVHGA